MENIKELMSENVIIDIKNKIEEAGGQEIFLLGYIDKKTKKLLILIFWQGVIAIWFPLLSQI